MLPALPDGIRLPKADTPEIVERLDTFLTEHEEALGVEIGRFRVLPSHRERPRRHQLHRASPPPRSGSSGLAFGAEDYTASMEIERTRTGEELFNARSRVVWAAKAAGVQAIDTIFSDVKDMEGFRRETELVKGLGYTGKSLVNPRQIEVVHDVFAAEARGDRLRAPGD